LIQFPVVALKFWLMMLGEKYRREKLAGNAGAK
jgi:hypothetical protein